MRKHFNKIIYLIIWALVLTPFFVGAANLVPCDGLSCNFGMLLVLVSNVLDYILVISAPIAAIMFAYAGFLYLSSQGSVDKRKKANQIFTNVGIGLFFVVGAWLIANAVLSGLETKDDYIFLGEQNPG